MSATDQRGSSRRRGGGFSLVELVIILLTVGVLAAIGFAVQWSAQQGVRDVAAKANVTAAIDAIGRFAFANDGLLPSEREFDEVIEFTNASPGEPGHVRYSLNEEATRFCVAADGDGDHVFVADNRIGPSLGTCVDGVAVPTGPLETSPTAPAVVRAP